MAPKHSTSTQSRGAAAAAPALEPFPGSVPATVPEPKPGGAVTLAYDVEDLGSGFEDVTADDFLLPFVRPLQKMSPECDPDKGEFIEGAKAGTFINTATKDLMDGKLGIRFIPVHRTHQYLEFIPRDQGGGFVASYTPDDPRVIAALDAAETRFGKVPFGDGNELIETFNVFGLLVSEDGEDARGIVIPFGSTQIGTYKEMMTKLDMLRITVPGRGKVPLPMFATRLRFRTMFKENKKGSWHLMTVAWDGPTAEAARLAPNDSLYIQAKAFRNLVRSGKAKPESEHGGVDAAERTAGDAPAESGAL